MVCVFDFYCGGSVFAQNSASNAASKLIGKYDSSRPQTKHSKPNSTYVSGWGAYDLPSKEQIDAALTNISSRSMIRIVPQKRKLSEGKKQSGDVAEDVEQPNGSVRVKSNADASSEESSANDKPADSLRAPYKPGRVLSNGQKLPAAHSRLIVDDLIEDNSSKKEKYEAPSGRSVLISDGYSDDTDESDFSREEIEEASYEDSTKRAEETPDNQEEKE